MPLQKTTFQDLVEHLGALGVTRGMSLLVQSQLTSFGLIDGGVEAVYRAIRAAVGPGATIAVPTYRLRSDKIEPYDRQTSPSQDVGVLPEFVRQQFGATRSECQIHSHAAIGPDAGILESVPGNVSFGPGSDFEVMHQSGFYLLMLGCDFRVATYAMHVQGMHGNVPYREWLELPRPRRGSNGESIHATCRYYARIRSGTDEDLRIVGDRLRADGMLTIAKAAYGHSHLVSLVDFHDCELAMLNVDPEFLIKGGNA